MNPNAIAVNVPPLGSRGPLADFDADDDLTASLGGITGNQWARSGDPVALVFPAASYSAGVMAATAAVAALYARDRGDAARAAEVSLLAGAFSLQTGGIIRHEKMTTLYHGPQDPLGPIPVYRLFQAGDGRYLFAACGNSTFWGKFAIAIERPDLVADERFENSPWGVPSAHWQELKDIIEPIIRTRPRDEWLRILREADVPSAPVMTRQEFIEWEQTRALGMRCEIDDPTLGPTVQMGLPIFLNDTPGRITGPAPARGDERGAREWLADGRPAAASPPQPRERTHGGLAGFSDRRGAQSVCELAQGERPQLLIERLRQGHRQRVASAAVALDRRDQLGDVVDVGGYVWTQAVSAQLVGHPHSVRQGQGIGHRFSTRRRAGATARSKAEATVR